MTNHPVTPSQHHTKSNDDPAHWETILRDAGLPPEPPTHHQCSQLPADSRNDFGDQTQFFDKNSATIFEAKQEWKQSGGYPFTCLFCGVHVNGAPKGTKYCCPDHRKRHNEGKTYKHVMCDGDGCKREIYPVFDDFVTVEGKKLCSWCGWLRNACAKVGVSSPEELQALWNRKHEEYLATSEAQWKQLQEMRR